MNSKFVSLLVVSLILTVAASGCRKRPGYLTNLPTGPRIGVADPGEGNKLASSGTTGENPLGTENPGGIPATDPNSHKGWNENAEIFKADTVHFDFDRSEIKASEKPHVAAVADYLKANPAAAVRVDGNCDERGTEEYNRSLGERRAIAAREELVRLGIDPSRVDTISYGEDKPSATGQDENAYRQNRRDDFVLLTPP